MTDDAAAEELSRIVEGTLSEAFHGAGEMVTRWVVIAETMDGDGARGCWTLTADALKAWDVIGLLDYALERERAEVHRQGDGP